MTTSIRVSSSVTSEYSLYRILIIQIIDAMQTLTYRDPCSKNRELYVTILHT